MTTVQDLIALQGVRASNFDKFLSTIKKAPHDRRTEGFYLSKRNELTALWQTFEKAENQIRNDPSLPEDDPYIAENLHKNIGEKFNSTMDYIAAELDKVKSKPGPSKKAQEISSEGQTSGQIEVYASTQVEGLARRIKARMAALKRHLQSLDSIEAGQSIPFYTIKEDTIKKLWGQITDLFDEIWQQIKDPSKIGLDQDSYDSLEDSVQHNLIRLAVLKDKCSDNVRNAPQLGSNLSTHSVIPLPKVTIPKFNGDYLKWPAFSDLFTQLVNNQRIPTVQKMWYLKANLTGEAENLISHISATAENYDAAWKMLQDRYNNKRVLVASLIHQLVDQPSTGSSAASIKQLHDVTQECLHALKNVGVDTSSWSPMLLHLLSRKLDRSTYSQYERSIVNPRELQQVSQFLEFVETRFQSMEAMGQKEKTSPKSCATVASANQGDNMCTLCKNGTHKLYHCQSFLKMTPPERLNFTQKQKRCVNCLKAGHSSKQCTTRCCTKCNKKHNTLLHLERKQGSTNKQDSRTTLSAGTGTKPAGGVASVNTESCNNQEATALAAANKEQISSYVVLSTAVVKIKVDEAEVECRALLDSGSQVNFITERLVKRLGISMQKSTININGIGATNTRTNHRVNVALKSRINNYSTRLEAFVLPRILSPQPSQFINIEDWSIPKNLTLADPAFNRPDKIDILLGAEHYHELLSIGQIKLAKNLPTMQNTVFGWVISGKIQEEQPRNLTCGICTTDESLDASIARLWELEEIKTTSKPMSLEERQCENHFEQHNTKDNKNRFVVRIPFHQNPDALGDSHGIAINRFFSLERRLQKDPELKQQYVKFMEEYENLGHMTKISTDAIRSPHYFIPHHCVQRPESTTTKLRVVFDASAKTSSMHSLNDLMYAGPTVQSDLFSILLRFRLPKYVFTTDVEKMYRQVLISPEDRQFQLIIWRKDVTQPITYYQLNTVTYGTRAAPYLATKCLQRMAKENAIRYPLASQFLQENFYVDDGLGGADSLITAVNLQQQRIQVMKDSGFNLRKWCANNPQLLKDISEGDQEVNLDFESSKADTVKTLGLTWLPKDDTFCVKVNIDPVRRVTKRTVTSDLARLFDPLGVLSPVTVTAKIFIQELWELKLDWDQSLPESLHSKWTTFRSDLNALKNLQIYRHIFKGRVPESRQLHIFTDASEKAYGAAAYMRSTFKDGTIMTRLLCSKSRVAPLKRQTIPRLELCAAVLGAQLASKIKIDLQLTCPTWFWTDSEIVLAWINSSSAAFNTFVANRIAIIQEITQAEQWRHVSSKCNPADVLSRGISPTALKDCTLWFCGPLFLHGKDTTWPEKFNSNLAISTNLERKRKVPEALVTSVTPTNFMYNINHNNSFIRLQRIIAYVLRFITQSRCKNTLRQAQGSLTTVELDTALRHIIRHIQESDFKEEIQQLKKYQEVRGTSKLSNLSPFLDNDGLIRVGGRLEASSFCTVDPLIDDMSMTQLKHSNQWMYTMSHQTQVTTVCNQEHSRVILQGTGLIKIRTTAWFTGTQLERGGGVTGSSSEISIISAVRTWDSGRKGWTTATGRFTGSAVVLHNRGSWFDVASADAFEVPLQTRLLGPAS
ncbi:uncharacterized protein [Musca autumnalis]|uniref:uncharacterized protein n=1 Tax=Musca autumnalis TaxID=221902 RepID=UPI003CE70FB7